jgi:hypothetical protein
MPGRYRSRLFGSVHEAAEGLREAGVISKRTMEMLDECLTPVEALSAAQIRRIRVREGPVGPSLRATSMSWRGSSTNGSAARTGREALRSGL